VGSGLPITVFNQDRDLRYTWIYNPSSTAADAIGKPPGNHRAKKAETWLSLSDSPKDRARSEGVVIHRRQKPCLRITIEPLFSADGS